MKLSLALLPLVLVLTCTTALAQWQWLDKDGRKVFSDRAPPPDVLEKDILKRPGNAPKPAAPVEPAVATSGIEGAAAVAVTTPGPKTSGVDKDIEAKKKQAADAEAAKVKAEQEKVVKAKVENCARAKQAKVTFDSGVRLSRTNASGEREIMDDSTRAAEGKRIQSVIDAGCK